MPVTSRRITNRIADWIEQALASQALGDDVSFDVTFLPGQDGPSMFVGFFMPSPVLGQHIHAAVMAGNPSAITEAAVDDLVRQMLEALRAERSKHLTATMEPVSIPGLSRT